MGMLGHAALKKTDGKVFAHIHPTGTVSVAAFMLAQQQVAGASAMNDRGDEYAGNGQHNQCRRAAR